MLLQYICTFIAIQVMDTVQQVAASPLVKLAGPDASRELKGVVGFLGNLAMGSPPRDQEVSNCTDFFRLILARSLNFYCKDVPVAQTDGTLSFEKKQLIGHPALAHQFELVVATKDNCKTELNMCHVQPLRTFRWGLEDAQRKYVDYEIAVVCDKDVAMTSLTDAPSDCSGTVSKLALKAAGGGKVSTAAPSSSVVTKPVHTTSFKTKVANDTRDTTKDNMFSFFHGKKTRAGM